MSKLKLPIKGGGDWLIPEGRTILKIVEAQYDEEFGKVTLTLATQEGKTTRQFYDLVTEDGSYNEKGNNALGYVSKNALGVTDEEMEEVEIEIEELVNCFIDAEITHYKASSGKTYVNLKNLQPSSGWTTTKTKPKNPFLK